MTNDLPSVLTLDQASALGMTGSAVRHQIRTGRWQRVYRNVYVTHSGPIPPVTRLEAALAYAGEGAALSHGTAALRLGLSRSIGAIHVTVPIGRRVVRQPGLVVHTARRLRAEDVRVVRGLACTSVERTVLDLVSTATTPGQAAAVILTAVGSRRTTAARLRAAWAEPGVPRRYRGLAREVLTEAAADVHSPLERRYAAVCRAHGQPLGVRQARRVLGGRVTYFDNLVVEYELVTELDGHIGHDSASDRLRDIDRDSANVEAGRTPLRVGWEDVLDRPCEVARQRAAVLTRLGWPGPPRGCSPSCPASMRVDVTGASSTLINARQSGG